MVELSDTDKAKATTREVLSSFKCLKLFDRVVAEYLELITALVKHQENGKFVNGE